MYRSFTGQPDYELFRGEISGEIVCNECGNFIVGKIYKNKNAEPANYYWDNNPLKCAKCYADWLDEEDEE